MIKLTIEQAALSRGIKTQKELREYVKVKTDIDLRPATISDLYRNNKTQINRYHLYLVMSALGITDFNEVLELSDN